jgi:hypothetical protein
MLEIIYKEKYPFLGYKNILINKIVVFVLLTPHVFINSNIHDDEVVCVCLCFFFFGRRGRTNFTW